MPSPPSRAAWIEIIGTESGYSAMMSPPSRAAWIEIGKSTDTATLTRVAAFTGGVD